MYFRENDITETKAILSSIPAEISDAVLSLEILTFKIKFEIY